jgi:membrane fusion protein (multidrug efflux system)
MMNRKFSSLVVLSIVLFFNACGGDKKETQSAPVAEIKVAKVSMKDIPLVMEFVGKTTGSIDAEIRARVDGVIETITFEEGKDVEEGQLLYTIDPAPFKAKVAEANARLAEAQTRLTKAESDLKRIRPLAEMKAVSERDLDVAVAQEGTARGAVDAAKASVESAEIELSYTKITAPTSGTIGISKAKIGEYVGKAHNPTILNTVSKLDPIHVKLSITENEYIYFAKKKQERIDAGEKKPKKRKLELILADGSVYPHSGKTEVIDRQIDQQTGTLTVEASFPNPDLLLKPGQFAKVKVVSETIKDAVVVPAVAIRDIQGIAQVFVIDSKNTVAVKNIKLGPKVGDLQVVEEGLADGDVVAVEGLQRLKPGTVISPVTVNN